MAKSLERRAQEVAEMFSRSDRGGNPMGETFAVRDIVVLSEITACVIFHKSTGKRAVAWFYYIRSRAKPRWEYFFVAYSHLVGLTRVADILHEIEQHNFNLSIGDTNGQEKSNDPPATPAR